MMWSVIHLMKSVLQNVMVFKKNISLKCVMVLKKYFLNVLNKNIV
jgi:hypothetical protein